MKMKFFKGKKFLEWLHYVVVFGVLATSWVPIMDFWKANLTATLVSGFFVFVIADQLAHKIILKEDFSLW